MIGNHYSTVGSYIGFFGSLEEHLKVLFRTIQQCFPSDVLSNMVPAHLESYQALNIQPLVLSPFPNGVRPLYGREICSILIIQYFS